MSRRGVRQRPAGQAEPGQGARPRGRKVGGRNAHETPERLGPATPHAGYWRAHRFAPWELLVETDDWRTTFLALVELTHAQPGDRMVLAVGERPEDTPGQLASKPRRTWRRSIEDILAEVGTDGET